QVQKQGEVIHVVVRKCVDLTRLLKHLTAGGNEDLPLLTLARADEKVSPIYPSKNKKTQVRITGQEIQFPSARNFR
ncbi:MAG: hypothetical protein H0X41_11225, partial [Chitinophagaceae bacterium]|nr:hypothetical protein [Chitinophagaceae bacterium]